MMDATAMKPRIAWGRPYWAISPLWDLFFILTPVLYLLAGTWLQRQGLLAAGSLAALVLLLSTEVLLGNTSHIGLTLLLLSANRALRSAPPEGWRRLLGASLAIAALCTALYLGLQQRSARLALGVATLLVILLSVHHNLAQCRGFFAIYERKLQRHADQRADGRARGLLQAFLLLTMAQVWLAYFFTRQSIGTVLFRVPERALAAAALVTLAVGALLLLRVLRREVVSAPEVLYLLRLLCYPVAVFYLSDIAFAGLGAAHGLEYFAITARLTRERQRDEEGGRWRRRLLSRAPGLGLAMALFLVPGSLAVLAQPRYRLDRLLATAPGWHPDLGALLLPLLCMWFGLSLVHFYLDSRIFRFRHPAVRQAVLPYLEAAGPGDAASRRASR